MSICDEISKVVAIKNSAFDESVCKMFEASSALFEKMVENGIIQKRGYQLMPIEDICTVDVQFNVAHN